MAAHCAICISGSLQFRCLLSSAATCYLQYSLLVNLGDEELCEGLPVACLLPVVLLCSVFEDS